METKKLFDIDFIKQIKKEKDFNKKAEMLRTKIFGKELSPFELSELQELSFIEIRKIENKTHNNVVNVLVSSGELDKSNKSKIIIELN